METGFLEIFTLVTGVLFLILEIRQSRFMWLFQLLSSTAAMLSFFAEGLFASSALNLYYVVMAFVGFFQWRSDAVKAAKNASGASADCGAGQGAAVGAADSPAACETVKNAVIRLRRPGAVTVFFSAVVLIAGTAALFFLLRRLGDPKSVTDAAATVLSCIATWWLAKSYPQQWLLWIVADALSAWLCFARGLVPMTVLYAVYALAAVYGYIHWLRRGEYIDEK